MSASPSENSPPQPSPAAASTTNQTKSNPPSSRNRRNVNHRPPNNAFKPKLGKVESLSTSDEQHRQDYSKFQKSLEHHVMTTYKFSKDMAGCILKFEDPVSKLNKTKLTLSDIRKSNPNYAMLPPVQNETANEKFQREMDNDDRKTMVQTIYTQHVKSLAERQQLIRQNLTILWNDILGQCTPALQEELSGDPDYNSKANDFDAIWLLKTLQKLTAGANKK